MLVVINASLLEYFFTPSLVCSLLFPTHFITFSLLLAFIFLFLSLPLPAYLFRLPSFILFKQSPVILFARYEFETIRICNWIFVAFSSAPTTAYVPSTVLVSFVTLIYLPVHFKRA